MKKIIFTLILPLLVVIGLVFVNREIKNENHKKSISKPLGGVPPGGTPGGVPPGGVPPGGGMLSATEMKAEKKKWEATPAGILFKKWEASPAGKKVYAAEAKIRKAIRNSTNMEGVVTSLSLPPGSKLGFGMMVRINDNDYILAFGIEQLGKNIMNFKSEFEQLQSLKVKDKIIIKSKSVMHAPKYAYPIVSGDYVERDSKIIYKRTPRKGGC
jgi:hypothetical protein